MPPVAPTQEQAPAPGGAPELSFRERKAAELRAESERETQQPEGRQDLPRKERTERTPSDPTGSTEDLEQDAQEFEDGEEYEDDESGALDEDLDDETPSDDDQEDESEESTGWEKRYKDLQAAYTRISEERGEMTQEHAEAMGETLRLKYDLEDRFEEAVGRAEFMANIMSGNANQFRNINWSMVPAEQLPQVQAQAQQAFAQEQQAMSAWQEVKRRADETKSHVKKREAEIAKIRLKRTIPDWGNEKYATLREFAVSQGMDVRRFNDETDPVFIEALDALRILRTAGNNVHSKTKRKAQAPRGKTARKPRDSQGRFKPLIPNQKGSFAARAQERLERERRGR